MANGRLRRWYRSIPRFVRRVLVFVIGGTVFLFGLILIVTPGPAIVVIPVGLGILAIEFAWARVWLNKMKQTATNTFRKSEDNRTITEQGRKNFSID